MNEQICRKSVLSRSEAMCERCCNVSRGLTVHHRKKRSQGGKWTPDNCVVLCGHGTTKNGCHSFVEHNPDAAHVEGFHVRPWEEPHRVPVYWRLSKWVLLLVDGEIVDV